MLPFQFASVDNAIHLIPLVQHLTCPLTQGVEMEGPLLIRFVICLKQTRTPSQVPVFLEAVNCHFYA